MDQVQALVAGGKFEDFAASGLAEYWIIDADAAIVEQYLLENGEYELAVKSGSGVLPCRAIEGLVIPINAIFDQQVNLQAMRKLLVD